MSNLEDNIIAEINSIESELIKNLSIVVDQYLEYGRNDEVLDAVRKLDKVLLEN